MLRTASSNSHHRAAKQDTALSPHHRFCFTLPALHPCSPSRMRVTARHSAHLLPTPPDYPFGQHFPASKASKDTFVFTNSFPNNLTGWEASVQQAEDPCSSTHAAQGIGWLVGARRAAASAPCPTPDVPLNSTSHAGLCRRLFRGR